MRCPIVYCTFSSFIFVIVSYRYIQAHFPPNRHLFVSSIIFSCSQTDTFNTSVEVNVLLFFFFFSAPLNFYATHEQQSYNISSATFSQWHKHWPVYCLIFEKVPSLSIQWPDASRNIGLAFHGHLGFIHCNSKSLWSIYFSLFLFTLFSTLWGFHCYGTMIESGSSSVSGIHCINRRKRVRRSTVWRNNQKEKFWRNLRRIANENKERIGWRIEKEKNENEAKK